MKLTVLFLTVGIFNVCASGVSQTVSFSGQNVHLKSVLSSVEKQTGFVFMYTKPVINSSKPVSVSVQNLPLEQFLSQIFSTQPLQFDIRGKNIFLSPKPSSDRQPSHGAFDALVDTLRDVKGRVVDENGDPLPGASITNKNTGQKGVTNAEGIIRLSASMNDVLEISYVGYGSQTVIVKDNSSVLTIVLKPSETAMKEVTINAGYYSVKVREKTGSIVRVDAKTIAMQPVINPLQTLQGRMSGVYVEQSTGLPGGAFTIRIRGINSVNFQANEPLYVIDGVPYASESLAGQPGGIIGSVSSLNSIDPATIESIEVLKDADATAIYGSRGANGVVLITTKKGKAGKTALDINLSSGISQVAHTMDLLNTTQFVEMVREGLQNASLWPVPTALRPSFPVLFRFDTTRYTNWQKELIGGNAHSTDAQATLSGGNNNTQFLFKGSYHRETSVFSNKFTYQKASGHLNIAHSSMDQRLKMILSVTYVTDNNRLPRLDLTAPAISIAPHAPALYNQEGKLNWENNSWFNPLADYIEGKYRSVSDNLIANAAINYRIVHGLEFKTSVGFNSRVSEDIATTPLSSFRPDLVANNQASSFFGDGKIKTWIIEPQFTYSKTIGQGRLSVLAGTSFQETKSNSQTLNARGFANDALLENIKAAPTVTASATDYYQYRYHAFFGRINYDLAGKYLVNLTGRRDGSSRFGPGKQFGNFGAVGAAWIFSRENLIKNNWPVISFGKLRWSYGITGSDQIGNYRYLDTYSSTTNPYQGLAGLVPTRLANAEYGWESNKKFEIALELGFLKDRVLVFANYYRNRSSNQLIGYALPLITGQSSIQRNLPATVENTGWEFELNTTNIKSKDFECNTSFNITIPRNKLISYPGLESSPYSTFYAIGRPLLNQYGYRYTGVDPTTGFYTYEDRNKDGKISFPDDLQVIGEISQKHFGGLSNSIRYKGWQLDFLFQWVKQTGKSYISSFTYPGSFSYTSNQPTIVLNRWQKPGDVTDIQKYDLSGTNYNNFSVRSDRTITDASFARLKNAQLSYQLPASLAGKAKLQKAILYIQGQNLFTITDYMGLDPESQNNRILPPLRTITAGIRLTL